MKKFIFYSLILFFIGFTISSCESNGGSKQATVKVPELLVNIMGLSSDEAHKKILEEGYLKVIDKYINGGIITIGFNGSTVQKAWGGVNTGNDLTNTAYLWLNAAQVMGFELTEGYIEYEPENNGITFYELSELKEAMKVMKGGWEMIALLSNSKKGITMRYECDNEALEVTVSQ